MGPLPAAGAAPAQTHRTSPHRRTQPTARRTLAALGALLAFVAVLVAVPLATAESAEAHTKTVKRCAYDPFTNVQQCWYEKVAHTHRVIPDNPPPDTSPTTTTTAPPPKSCPAGQHSNGGAGKNCHSHSFTPPCGTGTWSPGHGHSAIQRPPCPPPPKCADGYSGTPPNCKKIEPPKCADGYSGTPPNCKKIEPPKCADGYSGTPPNCKKIEPPKCADGYSGTPPNCKKIEPPKCADGYSGTPPNCKKIEPPACPPVPYDSYRAQLREQHRHTLGARRNRSGGTLSACHLVEASHCPSGQHEHVHGSQECHTLGSAVENASGTHSGWTDHCAAGEHSHEHSGSCHAADPPYYDGVKIEKTEIARGYICHTTNTKPHGEVKSCARVPKGSDLEKRIDDALEDAEAAGIGLLACTVVGLATAGTGGLLCGGAWIAATIIGEVLCLQPWCTKGPSPVYRWDTQNPPDSGDGSEGDGSGEDADPEPEADPKPTAAEIKQKYDEINEAYRRYRNGEITSAEMQQAVQRFTRWRCEEMGHTDWCNR